MRLRLVALAALVLLSCSACDWLQWGGGPTHNGKSGEGTTAASASSLVASTVASLPATSAAVTFNGMVYVEQDGTLNAFDANSHVIVWTAALPAGLTAGGAPAIDRGTNTIFVVIAGAANPVLEGFDANGFRNCNTTWQTCNPVFMANVGSSAATPSPPVVDGGKVFVSGATDVYAFDSAGNASCVRSNGTRVCTPLWTGATAYANTGVGPVVANGMVYAAANIGPTFGIRAFNESNGSLVWQGSTAADTARATPSFSGNVVYLPVGTAIDAFPANGCGVGNMCPPSATLTRAPGDAAGNFLATPSIDDSGVFATNSNGRLYKWSLSCGLACAPTASTIVHAPHKSAVTFAQTIALGSDVGFVLAQQFMSGADHLVVTARNESNLAQSASWDLGTIGFGAGIASTSLAQSTVYAPTASSLVAIAPPAVQLSALSVSPLALKPAFSPSIHDYTIACAAGTNSVTINMTAAAGSQAHLLQPTATSPSASQSDNVNLNENQAAVVEAIDTHGNTAPYWIRCLPHDFPTIVATQHPTNGAPTPGWYTADDFGGAASWAMILDTNGTPVWYRRAPAGLNADIVAPLDHDQLAIMTAHGAGFNTDPNSFYTVYNLDNGTTRQLKTVGTPTDLHELQILPNGDALMLSYVPKCCYDLSGLFVSPPAGTSETIADCEIQEVDPQGNLVWKWDASDHIDPVAENEIPGRTTVGTQTMYDVYHCNSIDPNANGNLLVSARDMSSVFEIRRSDGKILWKMGGRPTSKDGAQIIAIQNYSNPTISGQHDARYLPNGDISMFDDQTLGGGPSAECVEFSLNLANSTAQPVFQFGPPVTQTSLATGSCRRYRDGHSVAGWGIDATKDGQLMSEVNSAGATVFDIKVGPNEAPYRVLKFAPTVFDIDTLRNTAGT